MKLLAAFLSIVEDWQDVFPQQRTYQRAVRQALGSLICLGRRCLSRIIWTNGGQHRSWSAEYFLHSRCRWEPQQLFRPILKRALAYCPQRLVGVALDDTKLRKTGRVIPQAFYQRDPCLDLITLLRKEITQQTALLHSFALNSSSTPYFRK
jgi:hypothetical protein